MEKTLYYEIWNHLEKDQFPSKLKEDLRLGKIGHIAFIKSLQKFPVTAS
jgi:hypothetical protein